MNVFSCFFCPRGVPDGGIGFLKVSGAMLGELSSMFNRFSGDSISVVVSDLRLLGVI